MSEKFFNPDHPAVQAELASKRRKVFELIQQKGVTAAEAETAYEISLGVMPESQVREEVYQLAQTMTELSKNGLPLDQIAVSIDALKSLEHAPEEAYKYIDSFKVTDKERKILRSIVEKKRGGELEVYTPNHERKLGSLVIKKDDGSNVWYQSVIAEDLIDFLNNFQGREVSILFSES